MDAAVNDSEQFVYDVCRKSFLSMWSYVNPRGKAPDKELCDILVICDPHVVVFSVKACEFKGAKHADAAIESHDTVQDNGKRRPSRFEIACSRWTRDAVDASVRQVNGAVRVLRTMDRVCQRDGAPCLPLPPKDRRIYHRIAVAIGGKEYVTLVSRLEDGEMVHIWDEETFTQLLRHLDTITDFTCYLTAKMRLFMSRPGLRLITEGEEDLLAAFLRQGNLFPEQADLIMTEGGGWRKLLRSATFKRKLKADRVSYVWDHLIETISSVGCDLRHARSLGGGNMEQALRTMARECRYDRRILSQSLQEFLQSAKKGVGRSRLCRSPSQVNYVFLVYDTDSTTEARQAELYHRCISSISVFPDSPTVVGIGMNIPGRPPAEGSNIILCQISCDGGWPEETLALSQEIRGQCGIFKGTFRRVPQESEIPPGRN